MLASNLARVTECLCCVQLAPDRNRSIIVIEWVALILFLASTAGLAVFVCALVRHCSFLSASGLNSEERGAIIGVLGTFVGGSIAVFFGARATRGELNEHDKELFEAALLRYIYVIHDCRDSNSILRLALARLISDIKLVRDEGLAEKQFE